MKQLKQMKKMKQIQHIKTICLLVAAVALVFYAGGCDSEAKKPQPAPASASAVAATPAAPTAAAPVAFAGTFDPYLFKDKKITDRVVMKERPECGSCHIKGSLTGNRLDLVLKRGKRVYNWTLQGQGEGKEIVFTKGKLRIVLKDNKLTGKFTGDMHAKINLSAAADSDQ